MLEAPKNRLTQWLIELTRDHNDKIVNDDSITKEDKDKHILPVLSFHKLRHTSATLLIGNNTNIKQYQQGLVMLKLLLL